MKRIILIFHALFILSALSAQNNAIRPVREKTQAPAQKENFHLYLLIGQSNMAGRGIVEPQDTVGNPRILRLNREGEWEIAREPVQYDRSFVGVGPGLSFAREMLASNDNIVIGLVPCAQGGSSIDHWKPETLYQSTPPSHPYDDALKQTHRAMQDGILKGILWHQGESDSDQEKADVYKGKLIELVKNLRDEFKSPDIPFIAGEIPAMKNREVYINPVLRDAKNDIPCYEVVSVGGLTLLKDSIHLDAASQRELGKRYAKQFKKYAHE